MKRFLPALIVLTLLFKNVGVSRSADFQKGVEAYNKSDYVTALREWIPLAEQGDADVQYSLGVMHDLGQGVRQNYMVAVKWYKLAAEQGQANAQAALGQMHQNGEGVPKDLIRAHMWFHIAATAGVKYADEAREILVKRLSSSEIKKAQILTRECLRKNYKGC
tara:strand:+ start:89 stop:577 length:489 start_codon:yes stop_codon:yes gene_type:complete